MTTFSPLRYFTRRKSLIGGADHSPIKTTQRTPGYLMLGNRAVSTEELFRTHAAVHAVVSFLAVNTASTPLAGFMREKEGASKLPPSDSLSKIIRSPNALTTGFEFRRDQVVDLSTAGFSLAVKVLDDDGLLAALVRVPPKRVSLTKDSDTGPHLYEVSFNNGRTKAYERDEVFLVSHYSADGGLPASPLESLRSVLAEDLQAIANREAYWKNAARQGGVIERPADAADWSDDVRSRFREDWKAATVGEDNAGSTPVLEDGMHFDANAFSPRESEFTAGREQVLRMVAAAFGVPLALIGSTDRNWDAMQRGLVLNTLSPLFSLLEEAWDRDAVPDTHGEQAVNGRIFTEHVVEARNRGSFLQQAKTLHEAVQGPWLTPNEVRAMYGKPPVEGGDKLFLPPTVRIDGGE